MYIRRPQTRSTASGESYYTYRLVRSERVGGKVKQQTLLNLGRHFDVEQTQWPLLCTRIEALLSGQGTLMPVDVRHRWSASRRSWWPVANPQRHRRDLNRARQAMCRGWRRRGCRRSELGLRPVYHHKEERTDGHLFITVLAYPLVQIIRRRLKERDIDGSWHTLRQWLGGQVRVTAVFQRPDGHAPHVRKATQPEGNHLAICQALGIATQPGGIEKLIH